MQTEQRKAEARVLEWWRVMVGPLPDEALIDGKGNPIDPLLVPAWRAGVVGALALLDPANSGQLRRVIDGFYLDTDDKERRHDIPTKERIDLARELVRKLEIALLGNDPRVWRSVLTGAQAMRVNEMHVAIECLQILARFKEQTLKTKDGPLACFRALRSARTTESPSLPEPIEAFTLLRTLHQRLGDLTDGEVFSALDGVGSTFTKGRGNKSPLVALARLMMRRGAWGSPKRARESEKDAMPDLLKRLSRLWTSAPKRRRTAK